MSDVHLMYRCRHLPDELLLQVQKVQQLDEVAPLMPHVLAIIPHQTVICRHLVDILHLWEKQVEKHRETLWVHPATSTNSTTYTLNIVCVLTTCPLYHTYGFL